MKSRPTLKLLCLCLLPSVFCLATLAQGTAFTYQGRLNDSVTPASGSYDFRFVLYDNSVGGSQQGPILTNSTTAVTNGLFTATLDFGNQFPGGARWLEIAVRTNGNGFFNTLSPRQSLTPAPYAITAGAVVSGGIPAGTYGNAVTFNNAANSFSGSYTGNGSGVTNVNALTLGGLSSSNFWKLSGNTGANPTNGSFIGTTDNLPLEFRVNNTRVLRLEPNATSPNVIGGFPSNLVSSSSAGATIGGGGSITLPNRVLQGNYATVSGGQGNTASNILATVGGGYHHNASGDSSTISGGFQNVASAVDATVGGGEINQSTNDAATIGGGLGNISGGIASTVPGGVNNVALGDYSFAAGRRAKASHNGAFVWADSQNADFGSSANDQFLIRAAGNVGIGVTNPAAVLHVASGSSSPELQLTQNNPSDFTRLRMKVGSFQSWEIDVSPGATPSLQFWNSTLRMTLDFNGNLTTSGTVNGVSDRNLKEKFENVSAREVLDKVTALPISAWNFKSDPSIRHLGPMAQDFYAAFQLGMDDRHIATVDADGVALAAIQGLNQKVDELKTELKRRDTENAELKQRLEALEQRASHQPSN